MTKAEQAILDRFRQYRIGANEMLFFNANVINSDTANFNVAMTSLIRHGLVVPERRKNAYSLSPIGFDAVQANTGPLHEERVASCSARRRRTPRAASK